MKALCKEMTKKGELIMPEFVVHYTATEVTREEVIIEAETEEEAQRIVEEYEFDNSAACVVTSFECSIEDVEVTGRLPEDKKD